MKNLTICLILVSAIANAAPKASPSASPVPVPTPIIMKDKPAKTVKVKAKSEPVKKIVGDYDAKVQAIVSTCKEDKKICKRELKELRATIPAGNDELLKKIDSAIALIK